MSTTRTKTFACLAVLAGLAAGASADPVAVRLEADADTLAPGESTTVRIVADLDYTGQSSGVLGLGLFGFGGDVELAGGSPADVSVSGLSADASLTSGVLLAAPAADGDLLTAAAGRSLDGAVNVATADLATFTLTLSENAPGGMLTLDFVGAVVFASDDGLVSYSSEPGPNQHPLDATALELTVSAGCSPADINGDGALNNTDINAFISAFLAQDPAADISGDGAFTNTDINRFINLFIGGCN